MSYKRQAITMKKKKGIISGWVKSTAAWKFLSNLKLAIKRMSKTAQYWDRSGFIQTFRYFMAVEDARIEHRKFLNPFYFKGIKFDLRPMEWHLMDAILLEEEYGAVSQLFQEQPPAIVLDVGANVGMFSVYAFSVWPSTKLYAIEPGPDTFRILEQNQKQNSLLNWKVLHYAFWETDGMVSFASDGLSMAAHVSQTSSGMQVPAIRLDHFIDQHLQNGERISILKMDIEGAEEAVLKASPLALHKVDSMVIEIHAGLCNENVVRDILKKEFGFIYNLSTPSTQYPVLLVSREPIQGINPS